MTPLWSLQDLAPKLNASLRGEGSLVPTAVSLDTRTLLPGACFVALRADRDGHDFAEAALAKGATCLLVDHALDLPVPQLVVPDTLWALQEWGRTRLAAVRPRAVFGVTGSVGKTSTKELLAAATGGWKTPGNRNNTLGLPEALATLPDASAAAVLEMGMSTPGEIRRLTEIAPLDFGVLTLVGTAHLEQFPSGQEGIARAKGELVAGLRPGGAWTFLASDPWGRWIADQPWAAHALAVPVGEGGTFGWEDVRSLGPQGEAFVLRTPEYRLPLQIRFPGAHQVRNAALAAATALLAGWTPEALAEGLAGAEPEPGRGRLHALPAGGWLLDESYNASGDSIVACAQALLELDGGEPIAILGCMRELGEAGPRLHREAGERLKKVGIRRLWAYGVEASDYREGFGAGAVAFPDFEALATDPAGLSALPAGARILVKGSRFWRSERVVDWILAPS
jgi:UDP-N-acetylmuramoyl-tripeptide--D-alanyl-D-alanine ligase